MAKVKLLDNLIVGDGKTLEAGSEIDTNDHGIDAAGLKNLLSLKAVAKIEEPKPTAEKGKKAKDPTGNDDPEGKKTKDPAGNDDPDSKKAGS